MDNRTINVVSEGKESLALAIKLMWPAAAGDRATHYRLCKLRDETTYLTDNKGTDKENPWSHTTRVVEDNEKGVTTLIIYWSNAQNSIEFPYEMGCEAIIEFVWGWLNSEKCIYGDVIDMDGSTGKGFKLFTEDWGHVLGQFSTIFAVQPEHALYGK